MRDGRPETEEENARALANAGAAVRALRALTPHERGLAMCWFCDACREEVGPGEEHRCREGSHLWPSAEGAPPREPRLTFWEADFLLRAIEVAYDSGDVTEIFEDDYDRELMEAALDKLREGRRGHEADGY